MVVLKKIAGSSLIETLTASVIIMIVFMIASFSFSNVFLNTIKFDEKLLNNRLKELEYFTRNDKINFPYFEQQNYWTISGERNEIGAIFNITNAKTKENFNLELDLE